MTLSPHDDSNRDVDPAEFARLRQRLLMANERITALERQVAAEKAQRERYAGHLVALRRSSSWVITRPLRAAARRLRRAR